MEPCIQIPPTLLVEGPSRPDIETALIRVINLKICDTMTNEDDNENQPADDNSRRFDPEEAIDIQINIPPVHPTARSIGWIAETLEECMCQQKNGKCFKHDPRFTTNTGQVHHRRTFKGKDVTLIIDVQESVEMYLAGDKHLAIRARTRDPSGQFVYSPIACVQYPRENDNLPVGDYIVPMMLDLINGTKSFPGRQINDAMLQSLWLASDFDLLRDSNGSYLPDFMRAVFSSREMLDETILVPLLLDIEDKKPSALFEIVCQLIEGENHVLARFPRQPPSLFRFSPLFLEHLRHTDSILHIIYNIRNPCVECKRDHCQTCLHHCGVGRRMLDDIQRRLETGEIIEQDDDDPYAMWHTPEYKKIMKAIENATARLDPTKPTL